jgi:hydrogenase small subunit
MAATSGTYWHPPASVMISTGVPMIALQPARATSVPVSCGAESKRDAMREDGLYAALVRRGMSRRSFLQFSTAMAAALALPASYAPRIAQAVASAPRLPLVWIRGQSCGGNTEALLRSSDPTVSTLLLETLSMEYHEAFLAPTGAAAQLALTNAMDRYPDQYIAVIEGAIPTGAAGAYCLVGGRPVADVVREVSAGALATLAVGACAFDGGAPAASHGQTGATGVRSLVGNGKLITLPGCPMNVENLVATIVHYLTFRDLPPADGMGRPLFAYSELIHNKCERRPHFEFGEFALAWGDEGAQKGWCLYKLGCKGPEAMANCPTVRYGDGASWNVRAGHGCVGCTMPDFWDAMGSAYRRLPPVVPFLPNVNVDMVGAAMVGGIGAVAGVHAVGMGIRFQRRAAIARHEAATAAVAVAEPPEATPPDVMPPDATPPETPPEASGVLAWPDLDDDSAAAAADPEVR